MSQRQLPLPEPEQDDTNPSPLSRKLPKLDTTETIETATPTSRKRKPAEPKCCGILPCKGRTADCYQCDICLDCIMDIGCGHNDSRHTMKRINTSEEGGNDGK